MCVNTLRITHFTLIKSVKFIFLARTPTDLLSPYVQEPYIVFERLNDLTLLDK